MIRPNKDDPKELWIIWEKLLQEQIKSQKDKLKNNVDLADVRQQRELLFCEGVIHHTCRHFNEIVGCQHCMIKEYKAK